MSPSPFSTAALSLRVGKHTGIPPTTCLPYCLDNIHHHTLLILLLCRSLWGFSFSFSASFMASFALLSHLSCLLSPSHFCSLPFLSLLLFLYWCFSGHITHVLCWDPLRRTAALYVPLCSISHWFLSWVGLNPYHYTEKSPYRLIVGMSYKRASHIYIVHFIFLLIHSAECPQKPTAALSKISGQVLHSGIIPPLQLEECSILLHLLLFAVFVHSFQDTHTTVTAETESL